MGILSGGKRGLERLEVVGFGGGGVGVVGGKTGYKRVNKSDK